MDSSAILRRSDPTASARAAIGPPVGCAVGGARRERRESLRLSKGAATVQCRSRYPFVGGSDPGFRRLAPPKTAADAIAWPSRLRRVAPAHKDADLPGRIAGPRRSK